MIAFEATEQRLADLRVSTTEAESLTRLAHSVKGSSASVARAVFVSLGENVTSRLSLASGRSLARLSRWSRKWPVFWP